MEKKLTKKQRGFVKDYVRTENGLQSALKNYDIESKENADIIAGGIAVDNLKKPYIIEAIETERKSLKQALIDKGITEETLADKVGELLEAKKDDGKPDYQALDKGINHAVRIRGDYADDNQTKAPTTNYNFIFSSQVQDKIKVIDAEIKDLLMNKPNDQKN